MAAVQLDMPLSQSIDWLVVGRLVRLRPLTYANEVAKHDPVIRTNYSYFQGTKS